MGFKPSPERRIRFMDLFGRHLVNLRVRPATPTAFRSASRTQARPVGLARRVRMGRLHMSRLQDENLLPFAALSTAETSSTSSIVSLF